MKKYDFKHIAFHTLLAVYFLWVAIFIVLLTFAFANIFGVNNYEVNRILQYWIVVNMITGTALYIVMKLFKNKAIITKVANYSYITIALLAFSTILLINWL